MIHRKFILIILIFTLPSFIFAQQLPGGSEKEKDESIEHPEGHVYYGLVAKSPNLIDDWGLEVGVRLGFMISDDFGMGLSYYSLITHNIDLNSPDIHQNAFLRLSYGGLETEYNIGITRRFSASLMSLIGFGGINYSISSSIDAASNPSADWIFLAEPVAALYYRFYETLSVGLGAGYRFSFDAEMQGVSDSDISGPVLTLIIRGM